MQEKRDASLIFHELKYLHRKCTLFSAVERAWITRRIYGILEGVG